MEKRYGIMPPINHEHYFSAVPKSEAKQGIIRTQLCGIRFDFLTAASVFSTKKVDLGTRLLIESMILPKKGCILDMGCGYGPVGIVTAKLNPHFHVVLTDINIRAVRLAQRNIEMNTVIRILAQR